VGRIRLLLREPLSWFFGVAAVLLAVQALRGPAAESALPPLDALRTRLVAELTARNGRVPSDEEVQAAWPDFLDREILYREGLALGLDRDDEIVRRRLIQKMEFLLESRAPEEPPDEQALRSFWERVSYRYVEPARVSFVHVFAGDGEEARERAAKQLAQLAQGAAPIALSQPFLSGLQWENRLVGEVELAFGEAFARALPTLPRGSWSGPLRSSFGWHLVQLREFRPTRTPALEEVRARVLADWQDEARRSAREQGLEELRRKYERELGAASPWRAGVAAAHQKP